MSNRKAIDAMGKEKPILDSIVDFGPDETSSTSTAASVQETQTRLTELSRKLKELNARLEKLDEKL